MVLREYNLLTHYYNCFLLLRVNKKKAATPSSDSDQDESLQRLEDEKQELQAKLSDLAPSYGLVHPVSVVCFMDCCLLITWGDNFSSMLPVTLFIFLVNKFKLLHVHVCIFPFALLLVS